MRIPLVFQTLDFIENMDKKSRRTVKPNWLEFTVTGLAGIAAVILLVRFAGG